MKKLYVFDQDGNEICAVSKGNFTAKTLEIDRTGFYAILLQDKHSGKVFNCAVYGEKKTAEKEIHHLYESFKKNYEGFQFAEDSGATALALWDELSTLGFLQPTTDEQRKKILVQELCAILLADIAAGKIKSEKTENNFPADDDIFVPF